MTEHPGENKHEPNPGPSIFHKFDCTHDPCRCGSENALHVYRIGGPRRSPHWAHRWHVDFWFRSWQAEYGDVDRYGWLWCPRAWTKAGALRKARRWLRRGTDIRKHERRYGRNDYARTVRAAVLSGREAQP